MLGREPAPIDPDDGTTAVALADESERLSRNHVAIIASSDGLVAIDQASTNGTQLLRGDTTETVPANTPVALLAGDQLKIGGATVTVVHG